jgi:pimeloyl-ACP methyl ester carboxylesterase
MTMSVRPKATPSSLLIAILLAAVPTAVLDAQMAAPPEEPPADWGPISINMEEIEYPYPVDFLNLRLYGEDVRIAYMDVAPTGTPNGLTAVLLHGGSYYSWYWEDQIEALTEAGFRVIAKDRLGWGKSSKPLLPYSWSLHASNTAAILDHLGIEQAAVVGHSMGGIEATRFAFLYPDRATHLVMVNPVGLTDNRYGRGFRPAAAEVDVEPDLQAAYRADVRTDLNRYVEWKPEYLEHLRIRHGVRLSADWPRLALVRQVGGNLRGIDTMVNDWPHIATKAMMLGGEDDGPNFPANMRRAAETLQNAELVLFPGIGHNPHEEAPELVNRELIRFLSSDPNTPASQDWREDTEDR